MARWPAASWVAKLRSPMREAVFGALEAANTAFGLAPFAFDRLPRLLADLPSALPPGGDPDLLDPCLLERGGPLPSDWPPDR